MTTPSKVNKALADQEIPVRIFRNKSGYYYFVTNDMGSATEIPSIYEYNLNAWKTEEVVDYVTKHLADQK